MAKSLEQIFGKKKSLEDIFSKQPTQPQIEEQPLTPLTEEQKAFGISEADRLAPKKPYAQIVAEEIPAFAKSMRRSLTPTRLLPGGEGLGEKAEALINAIGSPTTYGEELDKVRAEKQLYREQTGIPGTIAQIGYDITGAGKLGQAVGLDKYIGGLSKKKQLLALGGLGAVEGATLAEDPLTGALAGGTIGAVAPEILSPVVKGIGKVAGKITPAISEGYEALQKIPKVGEIIPTITGSLDDLFTKGVKKPSMKARAMIKDILKDTKGSLDIDDIVGSEKGMRALNNVIKADDDMAKGIRDIARTTNLQTADDTQRIVRDTLGFDNIKSAKVKAGEGYNTLFEKVKKQPIALTQDYKTNPTLNKALKQAREQDLTGEMADLGDNTLGVAQKVKEQLDDMILTSQRTDDYGKLRDAPITRQLRTIKGNFVNKLDAKFPVYKKVRAEYGKAKSANDFLDAIEELKGNLGANEARGLLTGKNKKALIDIYGSEKANKFIKEIDLRSIKNDRLRKLATAGETQITKADPILKGGLRREKFESIGSVAGTHLDKRITKKERQLREMVGGGLIGMPTYQQELDPFVKAIMAKELGGVGQ